MQKEKRGLDRLSKRELDLLNKEINGKHISSFYSSNGFVLRLSIPSLFQLKKFLSKHREVFALDGTRVSRPPSGPEAMFRFIERHGISQKMRLAISEEKMKLNSSIKQEVFDRDGRICAKCGSTTKLCIDHIIPVSRGGFTKMENLQVLCEKCNLTKSDQIK